jgi:hypothetical protein
MIWRMLRRGLPGSWCAQHAVGPSHRVPQRRRWSVRRDELSTSVIPKRSWTTTSRWPRCSPGPVRLSSPTPRPTGRPTCSVRAWPQAMKSRAVIEQAKGILMSQTHVSSEDALDILRRASQRANRKLRDIAADIVAQTKPDSSPRRTPTTSGRASRSRDATDRRLERGRNRLRRLLVLSRRRSQPGGIPLKVTLPGRSRPLM